mmetsp:Transcript_1031/g.1431  ORF Transcript_1031/g.1431 Transcript_1031/m.1431 type:complete len:931 (-) Transcript_1031:120-2912(-)
MSEEEEEEGRKAIASRFADIDQEDGATRSPIAGLFPKDLPVPTLEAALASVAEVLPGFAYDSKNVKIALRHSKKVAKTYNFMTMDEIPSIVLYTMEASPREDSLYFAMNAALRDKNREGVKKWRDFVWLFLHALKKLPPAKTMSVVRGAKTSHTTMGLELDEGDDFTWSGFSSVTTTIDVMKTFLGDHGDRTLIQLELIERVARDIKDFSFYPSENELLLPPNVCFEYVSKFDCGGGLVIVQARQIESLDSILDLQGEDLGESMAGSGAKAASKLTKKAANLGSTKKIEEPEENNEEPESLGIAGDDAPEVREFLEGAGLANFADKIVQAGFDDLEIVRTITEDDLKELGLQVGHRRKFMTALKTLENSMGEKKPQKKEAEVEKAPEKLPETATSSEAPKTTAEQKEKNSKDLYDGARNGHADIIRLLVAKNADVNYLTSDKFFPLYVGASNGKDDAVEALLDAKADVNKAREDGATSLLIGAQRGRDTCVRHLIGAKAELDKAMTDGCTPLYIAAQKGESTCVKTLLDAKASPEKAMKDDCAPIFIASQHGHNDVVRSLIAAKAKVDHCMNDQSSPVFIAAQKGHEECVKSLIAAKADIKHPMKGGACPVFISSQHGFVPIVKALVNAKADIDQPMDSGVAPLRMAAGKGHEEVVRYLVSVKANINDGGKDGATPLIKAAISGHDAAAKALIELKASIDTKMDGGWTALSLAEHYKHSKVIELLKNGSTAAAETKILKNPPTKASEKTCRNGHALTRYVRDKAGSNSCNGCGRKGIKPPEAVYRCQQCDYDLCETCNGAKASGGFDGVWTKGTIRGNTLVWKKSGCTNNTLEFNGNTIAITLKSGRYTAEIHKDGKLHWSDGDVWEREGGKNCPDCKKTLVWSDYAEGAYKSGWVCNTCKGRKRDLGANRWFCKDCDNDYCTECIKKLP